MNFRFHFLNVGNGDCSIVEHASGRISVIDINKGQSSFKEEDKYIYESAGNYNQKTNSEHPIEYLKNLLNDRGEIFRFVLTHPDLDHMRGIKNLFSTFKVLNFWDTDNDKEMKEEDFSTEQDKSDWEFYKRIRQRNENPKTLFLYRFQTSECCWTDDGIIILSPTQELVRKANEKEEWNLLSYVLLIESRENDNLKILISGDATDEAWEDIIKDLEEKNKKSLIENIDVLIAPHHGRKSNKDSEFLKILKPKLTLIGNAPSKHLNYDLYRRYSDKILTNNQAGNVVIQKINGKWCVLITNESFAIKESKCSKLSPMEIANRKYFPLWELK